MYDPARSHASPRTAVVWAALRAELVRVRDRPLHILDAGGGSGHFAVPLAELGHRVTVVDPSPDALAVLERRAAERRVASWVHGVQGDADQVLDVVEQGSQDLVLCHRVLETLEDPARALRPVADAIRVDGCLSLLVANRWAPVLARALGGHFSEARRALADPVGRWREGELVRQRFDVDTASALVLRVGLQVQTVHGIRVVADLVPGALVDGEPGAMEELLELERVASEQPPLRDIATELHLLARRV